MTHEIAIKTKREKVRRYTFVLLFFVFAVLVFPALGFALIGLGFHGLSDWFFSWPQRVFPTSVVHYTGGQSHYHLYGFALFFAVAFWIAVSSLLLFSTRRIAYRKFVWIFPVSIILIELVLTFGLRLVGFGQFLDGI